MKIHYALYDKATDTGGAKYWTWFEPPLTFDLLDKFYGNFAVQNLPDLSKADLANFPFSGGIAHIADTDSTQKNGWIVLYRSFYGGERDRGRHGTVILTAWIRTNDTFEGLLPVFTNETFKFVEQHSKELPVPAPAALTETTGGNLPEKWQKGLEKFAPYITPRFDSHLKITDNPTGLNYEQSSAFANDRAEWEAEHVEKKTALEGQVNDLKANVTTLQSQYSNTLQRLKTVTDERDKIQNKLRNWNSNLMNTYLALSGGGFVAAFLLMFIISYASPNWSVNTINSINPFSSSAKPTAQQPTLEQQIAEVDAKLKDFDKKNEEEKKQLDAKLKNFDSEKAEEKKKLETKKKDLDAEKQKQGQEKQK
jgi:hypothetical protein